MKKYFRNIIVTILITTSLINVFGKILYPNYWELLLAKDHINQFHKLEEDSIDVLVLGSSHAWKGFDTKEFEMETGLSAYNYACNWQKMNTTKFFLKDAFVTQKPKYVIIECYMPDVLSNVHMDGQIYYSRFMPNTKAKSDYLKECFGNDYKKYIEYYIPLFTFHSNWENFKFENVIKIFKRSISKKDFTVDRGYYYTSNVVSVNIGDYKNFYSVDFSEEMRKNLDEIIEIVENNNAKLLLYLVPSSDGSSYISSLEEYSKDKGLIFFNMYDKECGVEIDYERDFNDNGHLNCVGAKKVANFFASVIKND